MTLSTPSYRSRNESWICRLVRSPLITGVVVLFYAAILLIKNGSYSLDFISFRGNVIAEMKNATLEEDSGEFIVEDNWDPMSDGSHASYGDSPRLPERGGVEIFPVQQGRSRRAEAPVVPEVAEIEEILTAWKFPPIFFAGGGEAIKGIYVLFHGCNHGPLDWFNLSEGRAIVDYLVKSGYAVVAPASADRGTGCWKSNNSSGDLDNVRRVLWRWYRDWSIPPNTPLFLYGVSAGGRMATILASKGGFQLCEKRTTFVHVSGVVSQVSWGVSPQLYTAGCPPLAFMPMPKGESYDAAGDFEDPKVFGESQQIPPQVSAIAHAVRKSGGKPRMLVLPLGEVPVHRTFFSDRVFEISEAQSRRLHAALVEADTLRCASDDDRTCFLTRNPRFSLLALETLVSTYTSFEENRAVARRLSDRREDEAPSPSPWWPWTWLQRRRLDARQEGNGEVDGLADFSSEVLDNRRGDGRSDFSSEVLGNRKVGGGADFSSEKLDSRKVGGGADFSSEVLGNRKVGDRADFSSERLGNRGRDHRADFSDEKLDNRKVGGGADFSSEILGNRKVGGRAELIREALGNRRGDGRSDFSSEKLGSRGRDHRADFSGEKLDNRRVDGRADFSSEELGSRGRDHRADFSGEKLDNRRGDGRSAFSSEKLDNRRGDGRSDFSSERLSNRKGDGRGDFSSELLDELEHKRGQKFNRARPQTAFEAAVAEEENDWKRADPSKGIGKMMETRHAIQVFRELLNVSWGAHEVSSACFEIWEKWLWTACGKNCRPGAW